MPYDDIDDVEPMNAQKHNKSRSESLVFEFTKVDHENKQDCDIDIDHDVANDEETKEMELETEREIEQEIVDCLVSVDFDLNGIKSLSKNDNNIICFFGEKIKKQTTTTQTLTDLISISQTKTISVFDEMAMIAQNDDFPFWE